MNLHTDAEQFRYGGLNHIWQVDPFPVGRYISTEHPVTCDSRFKQLPINTKPQIHYSRPEPKKI
jgi:hypothetical protein